MKQKLACILFITILSQYLYVARAKVYAEEFSLSLYPPVLELGGAPGETVDASLSLKNNSPTPVTLNIKLIPFAAAKETGQIQFLGESDASFAQTKHILQNTTILDRGSPLETITLAPRQEKRLDVQIVLNDKEQSGDHYYSVVFEQSEKSITQATKKQMPFDAKSNINGGIAANILLTVGEKSRASGILQEFSSPVFVEQGPLPFAVKVENTSSNRIKPIGDIIITNMFNQTVGTITLQSNNILAGSTRSLTVTNSSTLSAVLKNPNEVFAWWNEETLFGLYRATLNISLEKNGTQFSRTIHFVSFPLKIIIAVWIAILISIMVIQRILLKRKESPPSITIDNKK